jgi:hypothetical protein
MFFTLCSFGYVRFREYLIVLWRRTIVRMNLYVTRLIWTLQSLYNSHYEVACMLSSGLPYLCLHCSLPISVAKHPERAPQVVSAR